MRAKLLAGVLLLGASTRLWAAHLDVSASYRMSGASYRNLNLDLSNPNNHSFLWNDARLGVAVNRISLESRGGEETTLDVGMRLRALGVAGSTVALQAPLDRAANFYPSSNFTPFFENAYAKVTNLGGYPVDATFGRQTFKLGSGLLLDDDGAGLTGVVVRGELPFWSMKLEGFLFDDRNPNFGPPNSLDFFGLGLDLPTEGTWQFNQLFERDRAAQTVFGCNATPDAGVATLCQVSKALRSFSSLRYQINYGPLVFDGEAAIEKGAATPTGPAAAANHITYNGNAEVLRAKWKQGLYRSGEGIARLTFAHGSGDKPDTATTSEAFFPSHGHRFDGLERSGFGEFFGATPYDAYGGSYSTSTAGGLHPGASGINVFGAGYTPPAYKGVALDIDYFLFQADRITTGARTLGSEWDFRLRYNVQDTFVISASAALFKAGTATNPQQNIARKYGFQASGRF